MRLWFAFESQQTGVLSIAPTTGAVRQRQLNQMLAEIAALPHQLRAVWWDTQGTTCLEGKWLLPGPWSVVPQRRPGARQVRAARYDSAHDTTTVTFTDGSTVRLNDGGTE